MGETTGIEWTDATWNPWHGCHKISAGCKNCYMFREKKRYGQDPNVVVRSKTTFNSPLKWKDPRRVFTCSWSDFMIEEADPWRDEAWDIMRRTPQHTYQVLTKRIDRASGSVSNPPLPNVWLGVSVEQQKHKDRIDMLRDTPAALRFLSIEPLLEDIGELDLTQIDWVIAGGESGPGERVPHPAWFRAIRNQCIAANVPFFFKQWGEWRPPTEDDEYTTAHGRAGNPPAFIVGEDGSVNCFKNPSQQNPLVMIRAGKKSAGSVLDGREWKQFPSVYPAPYRLVTE
jgi:protein gp37